MVKTYQSLCRREGKEKSKNVTEISTKKRIETLKKAGEDHDFEKVRSNEGKIVYQDVGE